MRCIFHLCMYGKHVSPETLKYPTIKMISFVDRLYFLKGVRSSDNTQTDCDKTLYPHGNNRE